MVKSDTNKATAVSGGEGDSLPDLASVIETARTEASTNNIIPVAPSLTQATVPGQPIGTAAPTSMAPKPTPEDPRTLRKWAIRGSVAVAILGLFGLGFLYYRHLRHNNQQNASQQGLLAAQYDTSSAPLQDLANQANKSLAVVSDTSAKLTVNGALTVNGSFVINASGQPANPTKGQLYFNKNDSKLYFYNGSQFIDVTYASTAASQTVTSFQGQTGAVSLKAGNGIAISGTTISNSGVTSLVSGSDDIVVSSDGNGGYTISKNSAVAGTVNLQNTSPGSAQTGNINITGTMIAGTFEGDGSGLTGLNGSNIAIGTVADARLSGNVTLAGNTFNGADQLVQLNPSGALPAISGINLTNLNASNVTAGTLNDLRLSANVTLQGNTFNGANQLVQLTALGYLPVVNGSNVTNLNATNVSSGTLADARLSNNVALLNGNQTFGGSNTFSAGIGTNTITPTGALTVGASGQAFTLQGTTASIIRGYQGGFSTTVGFTGVPIANVVYNFDTSVTGGTYVICTTYGNCAGTGGGVTTVGGTANVIPRFTGSQTIGNSQISDNGVRVTLQNSSDSTNAFQVQNAAGTSNLIIADTTNTRLGIGKTSPAYTVDSAGDINSSTGLRVGGNLVCDSTGCIAGTGSGFYIQNSTSLQTAANFNFQSAAAGSVGGVIRGAVGQTADLFDLVQGATTVASFTPGGSLNVTGGYKINGVALASTDLGDTANIARLNANNTFTGTFKHQNASDSTSAFQIQNAAGTSNLFVADTFDSRIGIGTATPGYTLDVNGDVNIASGSSYRINGVAICGVAATCAPSSGSAFYIQNSVTQQNSANFNIQTVSAGSVVGILKGAASQTANLQEWQDSTGAVLASINANGVLSIGANPAATGAIRLKNGNSGGNNGIVFRNAANTLDADGLVFTTSNILTLGSTSFANNINGTYTNIFTGKFGVSKSTFGTSEKFGINAHNTIDNNALAVFTTTTAATKGLVIQGAASQTADLQQWQDSTGAVLASVNASGNLTIGSTAATAGAIRLNNATGIQFRNGANTGNINAFSTDGSDNLLINGGNGSTGVVALQNNGVSYLTVGSSAASRVNIASGNAFLSDFVRVSSTTGSLGTVEKFRINTPTTGDNLANAILSTSAATSKALVIQGSASQSANLQEWQSSAGTILSRVASTGAIQLGFNIALQGEVSTGGTFVDLIKRGSSNNVQVGSTSADTVINGSTQIMFSNGSGQIASITNASFSPVTNRGATFGGPSNLWANGYFGSSAAASVALHVVASASQSGNLQQWENSSNTVLSSVDANGLFNIGTASSLNAANSKAYVSGTTLHATTATADNWTLNGVTRGTQFFTSETAAAGSPASMSISGAGYSGGTIGTLGTFGYVGSFSGASGTGSRTIIGSYNEARSTSTVSGDTLFGTRSTASWDNDQTNSTGGTAYALYGSAATNTSSGGGNKIAYGVYGTSASSTNTTAIGGSFTATGTGTTIALQGISGNAASIALLAKGAGSQTGDLTQWQDSTGAVLGKVSASGNLTIGTNTSGSANTNGTLTLQGYYSGGSTATSLVFNGGGSSALISNTGNNGIQIKPTNTLMVLNSFDSNIPFTVQNRSGGWPYQVNVAIQNASTNGIVVNAAASQTGDLQRWNDVNNAVLAKIGPSGGITTNGVTNTFGNLTVPTIGSTSTAATGGTLAQNTTYWYQMTATNAAGETIGSASVSQLTGNTTATNTITLNWTQIAGATGYKIYRNTSNSFGSGSLLLSTITNGTTVTLIDTGSATTAGFPPTAPTGTKLVLQGWSSQTANLQEWQNSAGTVLASIASTGALTLSSGVGFNMSNATATLTASNLQLTSGAVIMGATPASAGAIRLTNATSISWRNAGNTADKSIKFSSASVADSLDLPGSIVVGGSDATAGRVYFFSSAVSILRTGNSGFGINTGTQTFEVLNSSKNSAVGIGAASDFTNGTVEKLRVGTVTTVDNAAYAMFGTSAAGNKGLVIQGAASQTADLQQWQDSSGTSLLRVDTNGNIRNITGNANASLSSSTLTLASGATVTAQSNINLTLASVGTGELVMSTAGVERGRFTAAGVLVVGNGETNAAPNSATIQGTASTTAATSGGSLTVSGGAGATTGTGSVGGALNLFGGAAGSTSSNRVGGAVNIVGGSSARNANGSAINIQSGTVDNSSSYVGNGGAINLTAGNSGLNGGNGGAINLTAGNNLDGAATGGTVTIDAGTGGTNGSVSLGATNASTITLGNTTGATTVNIQAGSGKVNVSTATADATTVAQFTNAGATTCTVQPGGTGFACSSDARLKTNVATVVNPLDIVRQLRGVTFNWTSSPNGQAHSGFIAQELEQLIPSAVSTDSNGYKVANYTEIIPYLVGTAQAQDLQLTNMQQSQTTLQQTQTSSGSRLTTLEQKVANLEAAQPQGNNNNFASLNVSGTATVNTLKVTGSATIAQLTVIGDATFAGNILVNGHIIGNDDTRGTVTIAAGQTQVKHTFTKPYGAASQPNVVLTATRGFAPSYRVESDENSFTVFFQTPAAADTVMNYQVQQ